MNDEQIATKMLSYLKRIKLETGKPMYDVQMMLGLLDVVRDLDKIMTDRDIMEGMAKLDGLVFDNIALKDGSWRAEIYKPNCVEQRHCADYLHNLNAVQRLIDKLDDDQIGDYHVALWAITAPNGTLSDFHKATARQKCEAILNATGKYEG